MATIRKRRLPSGKSVWQVDYRDGANKRRHRQFASKREADTFMVKARAEVAAGIHTADSASITVQEAADLWLARCERDKLEATTIRGYRQHVNLHIVPRIGTVKLSRLNEPAVNAFIDQLLDDGRSKDMAKRVLGSLAALVAEAKRRGLVATNHVRDATPIKRSKRENVRPEMPSKEELRLIIDAANVRGERVRAFVFTAIFTGLRGSELRGLKWEDLNLKTGEEELHVRRRVDRFNNFGAPKSKAGTRDIPLSPMVANALRAWKLACPKGELNLVFPNGAGNVESHMNILNRMFWPLLVAADVARLLEEKDENGNPIKEAKYSLHALRHAAAALWIEQGLSPKRIQTLMGHASIQQTFDQYGYLFEARDDDKQAMIEIETRLLKMPARPSAGGA
jgi:integrase